jgi:hypothetical protein
MTVYKTATVRTLGDLRLASVGARNRAGYEAVRILESRNHINAGALPQSHRTFDMSYRTALFALAATMAAAFAAPEARADYAFCSVASSSTRCDYQTYEQCQAAVSGVGADCIANPAGPPAASVQMPARKPRRDRP